MLEEQSTIKELKASENIQVALDALEKANRRLGKGQSHRALKRWFLVLGVGLETLRDEVEKLEL